MKRLVRYLSDRFIPHEGNDHQPHCLRTQTALFFALVFFIAEALYLVGTLVILPRSDLFAAILASVLVDQTNKKREEQFMNTLQWNPILEQAARMKANDMAARGYFAHNTPDGKTPWYWFRLAGYDYLAAGENLAVNFVDSRDVTEAWMRSPTHRANILNGNYTEIGIATAKGFYKGREAIFVVQLFGRPRVSAEHTASYRDGTALSANTAGEKPSTPSFARVSQPTSSETLGASIEEFSDTEESVIPMPSTVKENTVATTARSVVNVATVSYQRPNFMTRLLAMPRALSVGIGLCVIGLFLVALGLNIFIKIRIQHFSLIANGILLIGLAMGLIMMNAAIAAALGTI